MPQQITSILSHTVFENHFVATKRVHLMLANSGNVAAKNVTDKEMNSEALSVRKKSEEIVKAHSGKWGWSEQPLATISVRNVLANHRCIAFQEGNDKPATVTGEKFNSERPYHALALTQSGKLEIKEIYANLVNLSDYKWFITGIPVLWDDENGDKLFERMLAEAADISHIYYLPRGKHPAATPDSEDIWDEMHQVFVEHLSSSRCQVAGELRKIAADYSLDREKSYFHHLLGLDSKGRLCELADIGSLEELGIKMKQRFGVKRAICVDNGGSVAMHFYPNGPFKPCFRLSNLHYRPLGTAFIAVELGSSVFGPLLG